MQGLRHLLLSLIVVALLGAGAHAAQGYPNGHLPTSALAPILIPDRAQTAYLERGHVAAAWNTMNLCATSGGRPLSPGPSSYHPAATAYRTYAVQVILRAQLGHNAAIPGTSNHGTGHAVDLRDTAMRRWTDAHGAHFGFQKRTSDAAWEWWHLSAARAALVFHRPDPGASARYPNLQRGSGGACQAPAVKEVQRRCGVHQDGEFGKATSKGVRAFMADPRVGRYLKKHKLHRDPAGTVRSSTWIVLRKITRRASDAHGGGSTVGVLDGNVEQGQDVRAVQGLLNARFNELHRGEYRVRLDGVFGPEDRLAVIRFQKLVNKYRHRHLKVTGRVDPKTYAVLRVPLRPAEQQLAVSQSGASLVARFEGFSSRPYRDAVGVWTIGYGHTGVDVFRLSPLSRAGGLRLLRRDLDRFAVAVSRAVTSQTTQPQYDAMVSFSYNVGEGALRSSTLLRYHNARHYRAAADQFLRWNRAGGHVLLGLTRRRVAERSLYLSGTR